MFREGRLLYLIYEHYRYEFFCSKCGGRMAITLSALILGPGWRRCKKCGEVTRDGSHEWDELDRSNRLEYLFPEALRHYVVLLVLVSVIIAMKAGGWREVQTTVAAIILFSTVIWLPGLLLRLRRVRESRERFLLHGGSSNRDWTAGL